MPARSKNLSALRAFAAQHAAAHARAATVRPYAWCHCGAQSCAAHPGSKTHCAGSILLILRHDATVGRVWSVEEVCETCASQTANVTILARAARPSHAAPQHFIQPAVQEALAARPAVPGGFSSPAAAPSDDAAASARRQRPRRQHAPRRRPRRQER